MNFPVEIVIGVVAGIFTAAIIFAAKGVWVNLIAPWYISLRYKGADISGSWYAKIDQRELPTGAPENASRDDPGVSIFSLVLKQRAHQINGSMQFSFDGKRKKFNIDYDVSGEYWEGYLALYCKSKNRKVFSQGMMFLKLINNGACLLGSFSFRNAITDKVEHVFLGLDCS